MVFCNQEHPLKAEGVPRLGHRGCGWCMIEACEQGWHLESVEAALGSATADRRIGLDGARLGSDYRLSDA